MLAPSGNSFIKKLLPSRQPLVQLVKTYPRPDEGYEQWCEDNNVPCVGTHFPLANFINKSDAQQIVDASEIKIIHD